MKLLLLQQFFVDEWLDAKNSALSFDSSFLQSDQIQFSNYSILCRSSFVILFNRVVSVFYGYGGSLTENT
jgi:hypothetical protein